MQQDVHHSISDGEFALFQQMIHREAGIFLPDTKRALVVARLSRRLRTLALPSYREYFGVVQRDEAEKTVMLDSICTNETRFFREPRQFEFLESEVLPRWKRAGEAGEMPKRIRAWSAACSTGEEPYSLAMLLRTFFPLSEGWAVDILASDLSTKVLKTASEGVWPIQRAEDVPLDYRRAYMLRGVRSEEGKMRAQPHLRSMISFAQINLNDDAYPVEGTFDLIFCRNVLIYFDRPTKAAVIDKLARHLSPAGLLFLGHSETLQANVHALRHVGPTAYART